MLFATWEGFQLLYIFSTPTTTAAYKNRNNGINCAEDETRAVLYRIHLFCRQFIHIYCHLLILISLLIIGISVPSF